MMADITLESVRRSFEQWRSQRNHRAEPIPKRLWAMALSLYPKHKRSHICRCLGLSGRQFKQHLEKTNSAFLSGGFVLASTEMDDPKPNANSKFTSNVVLNLQGPERTLSLTVNLEKLSQVLPHFEALL